MPIVLSYGFDSYNQTIEAEMAQPLRSHGGGDTTAKVITYGFDSRLQFVAEDKAQTLTATGGAGVTTL